MLCIIKSSKIILSPLFISIKPKYENKHFENNKIKIIYITYVLVTKYENFLCPIT